MKVLQINAVNAVASTGTIVSDLSNALLNSGHNCIVAFSKGISNKTSKEFVIGNNADTKLHGLLSRITGKQGYFSVKSTQNLLKFMDNYKPDVVVLHNLHGNYINFPLLLKYLANNDIATVAVLHDCWFYTGKCCHYTVEKCYKWKENCGKCPALKKHNKSWFFDRTYKMLSDKINLFGSIKRLAVVGVSDWVLNEAKSAPVFKKAKIFKRIYNWLDTGVFAPAHKTTSLKEILGLADKRVILSVAYGWSVDKGIDTIIDISKLLRDDERILLVGDIQQGIVLSDKIIHIPTTDSIDELTQYYSIADVFVQPSLEETFGKVTAEALACGTPVVCFNSTTTPELVDQDCGVVLDSFDAESMLMAARTIINEGKEKYFQACRNRAMSLFSKDKNIEEYFEVFDQLIALKGETK